MRSLARYPSIVRLPSEVPHEVESRSPTGPTIPPRAPTPPAPLARGSNRTIPMPPGAPPLPFDVRALLAAGGMSYVYRVADRHGTELAIKVLRPEMATQVDLVARFLAEHEVACRIQHDNIVRVHDAQLAHGLPYLVMELVEGQPLSAIAEHTRLSGGAVAGIGAQVADALAHAHAHRILHCDVKPDNVLVVNDQHVVGGSPLVKLLDFGVARFLGEPGIGDDVVSGTPAYMAPEQWHGEATPASDIYALGCVLYELVAGRPPFIGNYAEIMNAHLAVAPLSPGRFRPGIPDGLEALILAMLSKAPRARPASMGEVSAHLADLASQSATSTQPRMAPPVARRLTTAADCVANDSDDDDDWASS